MTALRVLVVTSHAAGVVGGSSRLVQVLADHFRRLGHTVDVLSLPFVDSVDNPIPQAVAFRALRIGREYDRVVTLRWPSHLVQHHHKIIWFQHHKRDLFDLWGTDWSPRENTAWNRGLRDTIRQADAVAFHEAKRTWTISQAVSDRVAAYTETSTEVLAASLPASELRALSRDSGGQKLGHSVLYLNRITPIKRQALIVQALAKLGDSYRLVVAGYPESPEYLEQLRRLASDLRIGSRVEFVPGPISESVKAALLARSACAPNVPFLEDSHGFPTQEAAAAGAVLVTTGDAGGVLEFVKDRVNGYVASATPDSLANAIERASARSDETDLLRRNARRLAFRIASDFHRRVGELLDA